MKEITINEIRQIQLRMMQYIDAFCLEHDIRYWLCNGSLLGAVRHGGFIPWDDDIDIIMPVADYERFLQTFQGEAQNCAVLSYPKRTDWYLPHAKVVDTRTVIREQHCLDCPGTGVYIDIFPLSGLPDTQAEALKFIQKNQKLIVKNQFKRVMRYDFASLKGLVKSAIKLALGLLPQGYYVDKIQKLRDRYDFDSAKLVGVAFGYRGEKEIFSRDIFEETARLEFAGIDFNVPKEYDKYLRLRFGDYMQLPPLEEQVTHHGFVAYWKDITS